VTVSIGDMGYARLLAFRNYMLLYDLAFFLLGLNCQVNFSMNYSGSIS
jgi:hypothetical protein